MKYTYRYYKIAEIDIIDSINWYKSQKSGLEKRFASNLKNNISFILKNPLLFQIKYSKIRVSYLKNFPFGVHYYIDEQQKEIVIVGIFHTKRNPSLLIERLIYE